MNIHVSKTDTLSKVNYESINTSKTKAKAGWQYENYK